MIPSPLPSFPLSMSPLVQRLPLVGAISRLAAQASFEVIASDFAALDKARPLLPKGSMVSIAWLRSETANDRIAMAKALRNAGLEPVPHIVARHLGSVDEAETLVARLCDEAGVTQLFLIGGDVRQAAGEFASALDLLGRLRLGPLGVRRVGFGAYPEAHPLIAGDLLWRELETKIAVSEDAGLEPFVITQFAFAAGPILDWLRAFRARDLTAPVRIGLAGPASIRTLLRYARICGIGASTRALTTQGASIARMLVETAPDPVIRDLAQAEASTRHGPLALHFFPFGGLERSARWIREVAHGRVDLRKRGAGFELLNQG